MEVVSRLTDDGGHVHGFDGANLFGSEDVGAFIEKS